MGGRGAKEDNSRGKHVLCVRDQNTEGSQPSQPELRGGKMFSISNPPQNAKEKLMGKCSQGLHCVCVRFSGFCSA